MHDLIACSCPASHNRVELLLNLSGAVNFSPTLVQSFAQKVFHGLADSTSKLTHSVSNAFGRFSLDREYQLNRERYRQDASVSSCEEQKQRGSCHSPPGIASSPSFLSFS